MNTINTVAQVISDLYNLSLSPLYTEKEIAQFSNEYLLHPIQDWLTAKSLAHLSSTMNPDTIYHITDRLQIHVILIKVDDKLMALGPFCTLHFTRYDCQKLFKSYNLTNLDSTDYLYYRGQFPVINNQNVTHIMNTIIKNASPSCSLKLHVEELNYYHNEIIDKEEDLVINHYYKNLQNHYLLESRLMSNIEAGNSHAAILNLRNMQQDVAQFKKVGTVIENERIGAAITRTLVRVAAIHAGLPAYRIHEISNENAMATRKAKSVDEIYELKEKMIIAFCREINEANNKRYNNLVLSTIYYMQRQISQEITIKGLAEELDVSPNYLSSIFKKETGITPSEYLRKVRMKQAASLLSGSGLSIQDISNLVGISDSNYFVKLFKMEYSDTPSQYRKNHSN